MPARKKKKASTRRGTTGRKRPRPAPSAAPAVQAPPLALGDWNPKYLSEPDIPMRRLVHWVLLDVKSWSDKTRKMRMPAVLEAVQPRLLALLSTSNPADWRSAIRLYSRLNELELKQEAEHLRHAAAVVIASASESVLAMQAANMQAGGVTPDDLNLYLGRVVEHQRNHPALESGVGDEG